MTAASITTPVTRGAGKELPIAVVMVKADATEAPAGSDATAANQTLQITQETLTNTRLGDVTAPAAGSVNARLVTINTTLGSPFQAGGSIANTTFAVTQATASSLNATVTGPLANLSTAAANPFPLAARMLTTAPTYTNTQLGEVQMSVNGGLRISSGLRAATTDGFSNSTIVGIFSSDGTDCNLKVMPTSFNGSTHDRARTITGALADGTGLGVAAVEQAGALFTNITTATTTTVKSGKGILHKLVMNTYVASATITIYDNTAGSGTKIGTLTLPSTVTGDTPLTLPYDLQFSTGLTLVTSGATDLTVIYR